MAGLIKCGCKDGLAVAELCDGELDGVIALQGSVFEGGDPWSARWQLHFRRCQLLAQDVMKKTRVSSFTALSSAAWQQNVE